MNNKTNIIIAVATLVTIAVALFFVLRNDSFNTATISDGPTDAFAQCIADSGALFYGAWWCPACNAQKDMFAESATLLPYIECSLPGQRTQNAQCRQEGIEAYPTWKFTDGRVESNILNFAQLAEITGCTAPQN